ncbi:hypothetical protein SeMB42_g03130 [Synchytrium endobioticum]|uniref:MalT-like TPR region domain-containing protein n=1 Tax=Synchytrium endobioticum TaxID=286115 RepID=A0A507D993_9FUNG|nr:hypothetical protein SeMB42_g03130 [Synchytrium endobioticum]
MALESAMISISCAVYEPEFDWNAALPYITDEDGSAASGEYIPGAHWLVGGFHGITGSHGPAHRTSKFARNALFSGGLAAVFAALYWRYITYSTYPDQVRRHLRSAILHHKYKTPHDAKTAELHYLRALDAAEKACIPPASKEFAGIVVELGQLYDDLGQHEEAARTFDDAWRRYLAGQHYCQAVGAAQRTGKSYEAIGDLARAEAAYAWGVQALLGQVELHPDDKRISESTTPLMVDPNASIRQSSGKLKQPAWATPQDLLVALDHLANIYATTSRPHLAITLYTRSMALLDTSDVCKKAVLENNLAESYVAIGRIDDAKRFAERAVDDARKDGKECKECLAVATFNLGAIQEMKGDLQASKALYHNAKALNVPSTIDQIDQALSRIDKFILHSFNASAVLAPIQELQLISFTVFW